MQFQKKRCVAMLLAGGQGSRLMVLTENTAKPAVPFGGKYRIIDFPLSNCVNSKIDTVGILTQYQPLELNEYIGNGQPWGLNSSHGGVQVLPPYAKSKNSEWYKGTANAIYQNIPFIERYNPDNVLILSGDHIYKMDYAAMLRSCGNSRTPFVILLLSSTLHAALDLLFAGVLGWGIRGVALSTVLCQAISAAACIVYAQRRCPPLVLRRGDLRFHRQTGGMVLSYAWAAALQQAVVCIGRLLVQGMLTPLGTSTVTGYNMSLRTEQFLFCFSQGISAAMVVCLSQNLGHGDKARARRFYRVSVCAELALIAVLATVCFLLPERIVGIFSHNPQVIAAGAKYTGTMAYLYVFAYLGEVIQGFFRGLGQLRLTMVASLLQVLLRVVLSYLLIPVWGIYGICTAVAAGWVLLVAIEGAYSIRKARALTQV